MSTTTEDSNREFRVRDTRMPGHFWADNEVLDIYGPQLGAHAFAVYMVLARAAINGTGECRISMRKIGLQLAMSKGGVFNALQHLERLSLVKLVKPGDPKNPAVYVLANVKSLTSSVHRMNADQDSSTGKSTTSVHQVNDRKEVSVHGMNEIVHGVNAAFTVRTPNKERKTLSRLKTKSPLPPFSKGGPKITTRDLRNVQKELAQIYQASIGAKVDDERCFEVACERVGLDVDAVREASGRKTKQPE